MGGEVTVAEPEPRGRAVPVERVHGRERLARESPTRVRVLGAGERVRDRVEVGADEEPVEPVVVARVHDNRDVLGRDDLDEPPEEPSGPDAARQRCQHDCECSGRHARLGPRDSGGRVEGGSRGRQAERFTSSLARLAPASTACFTCAGTVWSCSTIGSTRWRRSPTSGSTRPVTSMRAAPAFSRTSWARPSSLTRLSWARVPRNALVSLACSVSFFCTSRRRTCPCWKAVTPTPTVMYAASFSVLRGSKSMLLVSPCSGLPRGAGDESVEGTPAGATSTLAKIAVSINSCKHS